MNNITDEQKKAAREAKLANIPVVRRCFTPGCGRRIWKTNETGRCEACQIKIDIAAMKDAEKLTNIKVKCQACGKLFPLRKKDHPVWTKWCPPCRTRETHESRGYEFVGGGEVGW